MDNIAGLPLSIAKWIIIEFVPKSDSQLIRLLATRDNIFPNYTLDGFKAAFTQFFSIERSEAVPETDRVLYLLKRI